MKTNKAGARAFNINKSPGDNNRIFKGPGRGSPQGRAVCVTGALLTTDPAEKKHRFFAPGKKG